MNQSSSDIVVVGAGIVGLAHAVEGVNRGLTVTILDRDHISVGASIRNFGHCCITAQTGAMVDLAELSRERWLAVAGQAGFWVEASGAYAIARSEPEKAVLDEMAAAKGPEKVDILDADTVRQRFADSGAGLDDRTIAAVFLKDDLRVDPRTTVAKLAEWLSHQPGVRFHWGTSVTGLADGVVHTTRGRVFGDHVYVCVGHDLDYLLPDVAAHYRVERCALQMALVVAPVGMKLNQAVLTGTSMLRYNAFAETQAATFLESGMRESRPELFDIGANIMLTRRPDGTLLIGDSHHYAETVDPFLDEDITDLLIAEAGRILGTDTLRVLQRWQGVYASSSVSPLLVHSPIPGVTAVSVTSGIGMTVAFGLAYANISTLHSTSEANRPWMHKPTHTPIEVHHA